MNLSEEQIAKLKEPLPAEAIKPHPSRPYLDTINPIYVVERLNDVFGTGNWKTEAEVIDSDNAMVTVKVVFTVDKYDIHLEQFGGNDNKDKGDALKGAATDALKKIGSYLGIGMDVWKDVKKTDELPDYKKGSRVDGKPFTEKQIELIKTLAKQKGFTDEEIELSISAIKTAKEASAKITYLKNCEAIR